MKEIRGLLAIFLLPIVAVAALAPAIPAAAKTGDVSEGKIVDKPKAVDKSKPLFKPKQIGPKSTAAAKSFSTSRSQIGGLEDTGSNDVSSTPTSGGGCTGSQCTQATSLANLANSLASGISSAASQRLNDALDQRQQLLQSVNDGVGTAYPQQSANQLLSTFKENPKPSDEQIGGLHEKLQDTAQALRTNQEEIDYLREKKDDYSHAASGAADIGRKLSGISDRATTIEQGTRSAARYPVKNAPVGMTGSGGVSNLTVAGYGDASGSSQDSDSHVNGEKGDKAGEKTAPPSRDLASAGVATAKECKDPKSAECAAAAKEAKAEEEKKKELSEDGKKLLAGMMQELKTDIANAKAGIIGAGDIPSKANGQPDSVNALANEELKKQSTLGGAILEMTSATNREAVRRHTESQQTEKDLLEMNKDIFRRVHDCIQRKWVLYGP